MMLEKEYWSNASKGLLSFSFFSKWSFRF